MAVVPILRLFDDLGTRAFDVDFLGFRVAWEHRVAPTAPLYRCVSGAGATLHFSQNHGDCCAGAPVRIDHDDAPAFQTLLAAKPDPFARPGPPKRKPWGAGPHADRPGRQ